MTEAVSLHLGVPGTSIRFEFLARLFPDVETNWDRDVIGTLVVVQAAPFSGQFRTEIFSHELAGLRQRLQALYAGLGQQVATTDWMPLEATVDLKLQLQKRGSLEVQVRVRPQPWQQTALQYAFEVDQTYLPLWIRSIDAVLAVFPVEYPGKMPGTELEIG